MYDRSVWVEQVDRGLYNLITKLVKYPDYNGIPLSLNPCFTLEDADLNKIELPTVMIRHLGYTFDNARYDHNNMEVLISTDADLGVATKEAVAKPYTLHYQLDFLSEYREDMNYMTRCWNSVVGKRYLLPVTTVDGNPRVSYMHLVKDPTVLNQEKGDNKMFRTVMLYDIKVELDMGVTSTTPIATQVDIDINS